MQSFQLGQFLVEPTKGCISNGQEQVTIEPKAMLVLCQLKANQGEVVSQQFLFEQVWPGRVFSPSSLQRAIAIIRKALNETSQNPNFLFTHPKLGYRLEVPPSSSARNGNLLTSKLFAVCLILASLLLLFANLFIKSTSVDNEPRYMTFGQDAEFNGQLSNNGTLLAFQRETEVNALFISQVEQAANVQKIGFSDEVADFVWHDDHLLVLNQSQNKLFSLSRVSVTEKPEHRKLVELPQWQGISDLVLADDNKLWFIAKSEQAQASYLIAYDLNLGIYSKYFTLPFTLINVALASSPQGIYLHYFDGTTSQFSRLSNNGEVDTFSVVTPDIVDLHWHSPSNRLLLSDLLAAKVYAFDDEDLSPISLPSKEPLKDIDSHQQLLVATQNRKDMDIVRWQNGQSVKLIDSKYNDYQASYNSALDMAFLSTRNGKPQIFVSQANNISLVFDNPNNIQFIPPLIWSPDGNKLVFVVDQQLYLLAQNTKAIESIEMSEGIDRVVSWSKDDKLMIKLIDGSYIEFDLVTAQSNLVASEQTSFIARDQQGALFGIDKEGVFWGDLRSSFTEAVKFAFSTGQYLVLQTTNEAADKLYIIDSKLQPIFTTELSNDCHYATGIDLTELNNIAWLCTKLESNDSEIVLFEHALLD